jgi:hypothetical protein
MFSKKQLVLKKTLRFVGLNYIQKSAYPAKSNLLAACETYAVD